jgi:hypothetical protein
MVSRGFGSESFLYTAAEQIARCREEHRDVHIYYFGDYDPSGRHIAEDLKLRLTRLAGASLGVDYFIDRLFADKPLFSFERIAVNEDQIARWNLPTRPTKTGKNTHAKRFSDRRSVELDAVHPDRLRELVQDCIVRHIDPERLARTELVEAAERESLARMQRPL